MKHLIVYSALLFSVNVYSQKQGEPCCTIIDLAKEKGTFTIRDNYSGRIQLFRPDALEGAELKVGDTVDVMFGTKKVTSVKGMAREYDLLDPASGDSCCVIMNLDSAVNEPVWIITAKNKNTGEKIQFKVPKSLAARLNAGNIVFTRPTHGYAMINAAVSDTSEKVLFGFPFLQGSK